VRPGHHRRVIEGVRTGVRRWGRRLSGLPAAALRAARRSPLVVGTALASWLVGLVTGAAVTGPSDRLAATVGTGLPQLAAGRWWTPLSAAVIWGGPPGYLVTTLLLLVAGAIAERRIGAPRTAVALIGLQVLGTLLAIGLVRLTSLLDKGWSTDLCQQVAVGAAPAAVGLVLAASGALTALWRRRLRLVLVTAAVLLVLYSGQLTDVVLLSSALLGLGAGPLLFGRRPDRHVAPPSRSEARVLVALLVAATAVGPVVAAMAQSPVGPLSVLQFVVLSPPPEADTVQAVCAAVSESACRGLQAQVRLHGIGPTLASVVPVLLLLVTAEGLRRGRRAARFVGIGLNLLLAGLGVLLAVEVGSTPREQLVVYGGAPGARHVLALVLPPLLPLAVAAVLVLARDRFTVRAPAGTYRRLAAVGTGTLIVVGVLYVAGGTLVSDQFDRPPGTLDLLADLPLRLLPPGYLGEVEPAFLPQGLTATLLFEWSGVVVWLTVAVGLFTTFVRPRLDAAASAAATARALLIDRGGSNLAWLTTWPGNRFWFGSGAAHGTAVAYRLINSVAVTTADPIGRDRDRPAAVAGFAAFCREHGWTPAFYSVTDDTRAACAELGWSWLQVAEEAVLDLPQLEFTGKRWQDVRTAMNRAEKDGITAEWISYAVAPPVLVDQIRAISEEWVADKGLPEMGFTLGGLDELADEEVRVLVAVDADRTVHAATSWMPIHRDGKVVGWTLDFMRRRGQGGFRAAVEFLIATAARDLRDEGYEVVSLSGAPLAQLDRGQAPRGLQRLLDVAGQALEPVYGFRSLLAFKAKFQPTYLPLYLAYPDPVALPAIGLAIGRAYLPDLTAGQSARLLSRLRS
jgi:phosphatidylglycerol lysyltransferase